MHVQCTLHTAYIGRITHALSICLAFCFKNDHLLLCFDLFDKNENDFLFQQVFDIGKGEHCPITGIEFHKVPNTTRYIVLVSTVNRLYKFHETLRFDDKPPYLQVSNKQTKSDVKTKILFHLPFQHIFNSYLNVPEDIKDFHQIPNKLKYSKLRVNYDKVIRFPKSFGWMTDIGIYTGEVS